MYGDDVRAVQNKLNSLGYNCGTADGYYGNATKSAVISFQSAKGLTACLLYTSSSPTTSPDFLSC